MGRANAFADDRDRCFAAGMSDHIAKPLEPGVFYSILLKRLLNPTMAGVVRSASGEHELARP
jgi:CheY-like chemotaxis protein